MTYFDPLLDELTAARQWKSPINTYGQQLVQAQIPTITGGGFWKNLAAQIVPDLLGAGLSYLGQQQEQEKQQQIGGLLLEAAKETNPTVQADILTKSGRPDLAAKVLLAYQEQQKVQDAYIKQLDAQFEHGAKKEYDMKAGEREADAKYRSAMLGLQQGDLAYKRGDLEQRKIEAKEKAKAELAKQMMELELKGSAEVIKDPTVQDYKKALPYGSALKQIIENGGDSGVAGIAVDKAFSRIVSPEAVNEGDIKILGQAGGFRGQAEDIAKWLTGDAGKNPAVLREIGNIANRVLEGKRQAAVEAQVGVQDRYRPYGVTTERVGTALPSVVITSPKAELEPRYEYRTLPDGRQQRRRIR